MEKSLCKFPTHDYLQLLYSSFPTADYNGPLRNDVTDAGEPDVIVMTRLQIAMSREFFGWPLYTIVMGLGQVWHLDALLAVITNNPYSDVERHQFPDHVAYQPLAKLANKSPAVCPWRGIPGGMCHVVHHVPPKTFSLCSFRTLVILWSGIFHDWFALDFTCDPSPSTCVCSNLRLVICHWICRCFPVLWAQFRRGSSMICYLSYRLSVTDYLCLRVLQLKFGHSGITSFKVPSKFG